MKNYKILFALFFSLFSISYVNAATAKAVQPEEVLKVPFTKNEAGRVIFDNVKDMVENAYLIDEDEKDKKLHSLNPLKLTLPVFYFEGETDKFIQYGVNQAFIEGVYDAFIYSNIDQIDLTVNVVDFKTKKLLPKKAKISAKVNRDLALKVLETYISAKSFDDLVSFDETIEDNVIGYYKSKKYQELADEEIIGQIAKALTTGKFGKQ